ncbi:MAG: hypothetical protein H0V61_02595 [Chitinophagales bacterium]|nr:hypothetical protein [Chitinophagales bacterium]
MNKIIALFSLVLILNLTNAKAQSTSVNDAAPDVKKEVTSDATKQCHGTAKATSHSCSGKSSSGTSATLTNNHTNTGSVVAAETETIGKKEMKAACAGDAAKACCKSKSRSSALLKNNKSDKASTNSPALNQQQ